MRRASFITAVCTAAWLACPTPPKPPAVLELGEGPFLLRTTADGGTVTLVRTAADLREPPVVLLTLPPDAVQLGTVPALDDALSYDPYWLEQKDAVFSPVTPRGLRWRTATAVTAVQVNRQVLELVYLYEGGSSAKLTLTSGGSGFFEASATPAVPTDGAVAFIRLRLRASADEGFYGLGEWFDSVNHRGKRRPMQLEADLSVESAATENHVAVPLLIGTRGWGIFVESRRPGLFDVAQKEPDLVEVTFGTAWDSAAGLDFHLFAAEHPLDVTRYYYGVTGAPALPAPWALGPWVWRDESRDQAQVLDDIAQVRARDLATSGVWIDRPYASFVNSFDFDPARFPDAGAMFATAREQGLAVALWHTPYLEPGAEPFRSEALARGYFPPQTGAQLNRWSAPLDFTSQEALLWWHGLLGRYVGLGVQGFKLDFAEDVVTGVSGTRTAWRFADGSDERTMHSRYTLLYHSVYAAQFQPETSFLLCRAGKWGDQVHAPIIWPGDIDATLTRFGETFTKGSKTVTGVGGLPSAVVAGLSLGPSGFPFFGADTGGYRHSPPDRETWVRWVEQSALSTVMQTGDSSSQVPWEYTPENGRDDAALDVYRRYARLHLRLFPYLWTYAKQLATTGVPILRALGLAYPELGVHPDDEYLVGDSLLVAPVVTRGATTRTLTLPPGRWLSWWDGAAHEGGASGATVTVPAPLEVLPLFLEAGAIVPMLRPTIDTLAPATAAGVDSFVNDAGLLYLRVAPGAAGSFSVYDGSGAEQTAGGELRLSSGTVFTRGAVIERIATARPAAVELDGAPLPEVPQPALEGAAQGFAWNAETGGTLWVRVPPGSRRVSFR